MKNPTNNEILTTLFIILVISLFTLYNLRVSLRRSRDSQRRSDINSISDALNNYQKDFGFFPPSTTDGKILGCKGANFGIIPSDLKDQAKMSYYLSTLRGCDWGIDGLRDLNDDSYQPYLNLIPKDPKGSTGFSYIYISDMNRYQLFAYLEGEDDEEGYRFGIVKRNLNCGIKTCNFGKAFGETPLEISIEAYENEIKSIDE